MSGKKLGCNCLTSFRSRWESSDESSEKNREFSTKKQEEDVVGCKNVNRNEWSSRKMEKLTSVINLLHFKLDDVNIGVLQALKWMVKCVCLGEPQLFCCSPFLDRIPVGLQELLNEMEGSGQEWWRGPSAVGGVSVSHLLPWLNNRMLYENKNIICLLEGGERPSDWLPPSLCAVCAECVHLRLCCSVCQDFMNTSHLQENCRLKRRPYCYSWSLEMSFSSNQRRIQTCDTHTQQYYSFFSTGVKWWNMEVFVGYLWIEELVRGEGSG